MSGMTYIDGHPYVWGRPATRDEKEPLLDCFSRWLCPHCGANLTSGAAPICLNACHLTAPQYAKFNALLRDKFRNEV